MTHSTGSERSNFLLKDLGIIVLSVLIAVLLLKTNALSQILTSAKGLEMLGSFIAGMFFTSVFTTAPAIVTLGEIAKTNSILLTAIFGTFGAVLGDIVIFKFIRDRFSEHLLELTKHQGIRKRIRALFKHKSFRWMTFIVGSFIIASPFPDELGIGLLGFSKMKMSRFIPISITFNFIGIILIGLVAKAL